MVLWTSTVRKMPKPPRRPWKMVKLMETKLLWTGPSLRAKVASVAEEEAGAALEVEVVAEVAAVDLVAEAGEALEGEAASEEAEEEEEETTSHKERRPSLNSFFYPCRSSSI